MSDKKAPISEIADIRKWFASREAVFMAGAGSSFGRAALRYQVALRADRLRFISPVRRQKHGLE